MAGLEGPDRGTPDPLTDGTDFALADQEEITASGLVTRINDNLAALRTLRTVQAEGRAATPQEQSLLARWTSWGAVPAMFDPRSTAYPAQRDELARLLTPAEWRAAARTTINAHYTDTAYVDALWSALTGLGLTGGEVLEPGCGAGTFIGRAPEGVHVTGVELDPTTAAIAALLYPQRATVHAASFAHTNFARDCFDAVIGNVPFGQVHLHDPVFNRARRVIHNHFIVKSVAMLKPGGVMAVLTSRYTLDALDPDTRAAIYADADLLGAIRLPTGAHARAAMTDAITDVLLLRKRLPGEARRDATWLHTTMVSTGVGMDGLTAGEDARVNAYFTHHPEHVLGEFALGQGMYGPNTLLVRNDADRRDLANALHTLTAQIVATAHEEGLVYAADSDGISPGPQLVAHAPDATRLAGYLSLADDGTLTAHAAAGPEPVRLPKTQISEVRALLGIRDALQALLTAEASDSAHTTDLEDLRRALNNRYDAYVKRYGAIGRFTLARTGRVDEDGTDIMRQVSPPAVTLIRRDPFGPSVLALEVFDPATQTAAKAAILSRRVVAPRQAQRSADGPADALALCLDAHGRVDLDHIADLLDTTPEQARTQLGALVFDDPDDGLVTASEYLSGNVRAKLARAIEAAADDPTLRVNVEELRQVQPVDLNPSEISVALGAVWVPAKDVQDFLAAVLNDRSVDVQHFGGSEWKISGNRWSVRATSTYGTERMNALVIAQRLSKQQKIVVNDIVTDDEGRQRSVVNPEETTAAAEKAALLQERFGEWAWEDPARAQRLARIYNDTFNAVRLRTYSTDHLTLPGLALTFTPRAHQKAAVARMIAEPAVGLFHEVGAGKTSTMAMGVMELKRLGMVRKPAIVVPNHMLDQFTREFLQLYPRANVLAAGISDLHKEKRRAFVARIATGDWDAVIMTRTAFEVLPVSSAAQHAYEQDTLDGLREQLAKASAIKGASQTIKRMERQLLEAEERLKAKLDRRRDAGVTFEESGIDYLCIDELHDYKNRSVVSSIEGVARAGSQRATDLDMKLHLLRNRYGHRVVTGATATPIANTVSEAWVMQTYLRPDILKDAGLSDFDSWAATFGEQVTEVELAPEGGGRYRTTTRFARFRNVPELLQMWHRSADIKTAEDLNLPTPALRARSDGQRVPEVIAIAPSGELRDYVSSLADRAEDVRAQRVDPSQDNMLKITGDGRKAALDMRLVSGPDTTALVDLPTKLDIAAARIHRIWSEYRATPFLTAAGEESPRPGALQLVFCDLGTPSEERWNVYDELKRKLVDHGMDPTRIRYIHEAHRDSQKAALFEDCREGRVDVILGSTSRMGVGTNIQSRAVALHHLDCPWRPADIAQREGRIIRQGNQNTEVGIYRYVVEGSFDAYMWQTVERKARFIAQVVRGRLDLREIEDVGDSALSFAEVKALASGDPNILAKAEADLALTKYERLHRSWERTKAQLTWTIDSHSRRITERRDLIPVLEDAIAQSVDTTGEAFVMTLRGTPYRDRSDATRALRDLLLPALTRTESHAELRDLVQLGGHIFDASLTNSLGQQVVSLSLQSVPQVKVTIDRLTLAAESGHGLVTRLENRIRALPQVLEEAHELLETLTAERDRAHLDRDKPFPHTAALAAARERVHDLTQLMSAGADRPRAPYSGGISGAQALTEAACAPLPSASAVTSPTQADHGGHRAPSIGI